MYTYTYILCIQVDRSEKAMYVLHYETEVYLQIDINRLPHHIVFGSLRISCSCSLVSLWFPVASVFIFLATPTLAPSVTMTPLRLKALFLLNSVISYCTVFFFFPYSCTFPAKATLLVSLYIFSLNICFCSSKIRGNLFFINLKFLCPAIEICTCCLIGISVLTFSKYLKFSMYKTGLTKLPTAYSTSVNGEYTSQHLTSCFSERPRCEFCLILMCN